MWSVKCEVWSVKEAVRSEKCGVWSVKCGVWSVKCGVRRVQCAVWGVECRGKDTVGTGCLWTIGHLCLGNFRRRLARVYVNNITYTRQTCTRLAADTSRINRLFPVFFAVLNDPSSRFRSVGYTLHSLSGLYPHKCWLSTSSLAYIVILVIYYLKTICIKLSICSNYPYYMANLDTQQTYRFAGWHTSPFVAPTICELCGLNGHPVFAQVIDP